MGLKYNTPVTITPAPPKGTEIFCTRITILPESGDIAYEFQAKDADGVKVGDIHANEVIGKDFQLSDTFGTVLVSDIYAALKEHTYSVAADLLGAGGTIE